MVPPNWRPLALLFRWPRASATERCDSCVQHVVFGHFLSFLSSSCCVLPCSWSSHEFPLVSLYCQPLQWMLVMHVNPPCRRLGAAFFASPTFRGLSCHCLVSKPSSMHSERRLKECFVNLIFEKMKLLRFAIEWNILFRMVPRLTPTRTFRIRSTNMSTFKSTTNKIKRMQM